MPYAWLPPDGTTRRLRLWPHQSLTPRGFVWFVGATALLLAVPLIALLGTVVLWGLLPFLVLAVAGLWTALRRSWRDREITEVLTLSPDRAELRRHDRLGERRWDENTYWVRVTLHQTGGPVPQYLTLRGQGREVELGAFLTEDERIALHRELLAALADLR
ncbi:MAG: hypothetical protein RLZZ528_671 [Pseudomonadota bacterium]|jgi:uncharacterized membrane protein